MRLPLPRQPCYRGHYRWLGRIGTVGSPVYGTTMHLLHKTLAWLVRRFSGCRGFAFLFGGRLPPYCSGGWPGPIQFWRGRLLPLRRGAGKSRPPANQGGEAVHLPDNLVRPLPADPVQISYLLKGPATLPQFTHGCLPL